MLFNEALAAHRQGRINAMEVASCACTGVVWLLSLGVIVIAVAQKIGMFLG